MLNVTLPRLRICLIASLCCASIGAIAVAEQPDEILNLWPAEPPGERMEVGPEQDITQDSDGLIAGRRIIKLANVATPQAHVFLPPANLRSGACVIVCPGGGFNILAWDLEGTEVAQWLNTLGAAAVVLKYRVPTRQQEPPWKAPAQDAQRAISLARSNAEKWQVDQERVGVLGFSAGGVTAFRAAIADKRLYEPIDDVDSMSCLPNRVMLIYAAGLPKDGLEAADLKLTAQTPPMFIVHAFDDFVPVEGTANLLVALKKAGVPSELHIYDAGGHGYGLRERSDLPVTHWSSRCEDWLRRGKWID